MPLLVGQLIYTSLPKIGFQLLTSQQIPPTVQDAFVNEIVFQMWSAYNPPPVQEQASFLHQISPNQTLFGWLYNDGTDELGRSHVPYFLSYYLSGVLEEDQLTAILGYIAQGPIYFLERERLSSSLENVILPDLEDYQPARLGVGFPPPRQSDLLQLCRQQRLIQRQTEIFSPINDYCEDGASSVLTLRELPPPALAPHPSLGEIERLFQSLLREERGLTGLLLLSESAYPLTTPLGFSPQTAQTLGKKILALVHESQQALRWNSFNHLSLQTPEGHLVLSYCFDDYYLLTKTEEMLTGVAEVEIKRLIKQIRAIYYGEEQFVSYTPLSLRSPQRGENESPEAGELSPPEGEILYRGRRPIA